MMPSIRTSLLAGTLVGTILVLVGAGIAVERGVRSALMEQVDRSLEDEARLLASTVENSDEGTEVEFDELDMRDFEDPDGPGYLLVELEGGEVLYRSPGAVGVDLTAAAGDDPSVFRSTRVNGHDVRLMVLRFTPRVVPEDDPDEAGAALARPVVLSLARRTEATDAFLARLRLLLGIVGLVAGVLVLVVQRAVIQRSLRPLDRLAREIADLGEELSARVTVTPIPREVGPVVRRINELLDRVESAFERERTFSADVAHELRTPLAGLRTSMEVELSRPRDEDQYRAALRSSLDIVCQLQVMVQRLLCLARLESGQIQIDAHAQDLCEDVRATCESLKPLAARRQVDVRCDLPDRVEITTDRALTEVVIRNVIENALLHVDEGGHVDVEVLDPSTRPVLRITNSGSRVAQNQAAGLFERFARGDASRDRTGEHCGLGLALVDKISSLLGMEISIETSIGGEFRISLRMPGTDPRLAV